jgi:hypothetical protein
MWSTHALQRNVVLTIIHMLLVTHKGKSATPTANNCQGQAKTPQSVSVPQSHDCIRKTESASPLGKTTVKVKRKLFCQYQYPSHMIVHTRENRLPPRQNNCQDQVNKHSWVTQLHDCSCYVSIRIPTPPPLCLQNHADLRAHDSVPSLDLWHQPRFANVTWVWNGGYTISDSQSSQVLRVVIADLVN